MRAEQGLQERRIRTATTRTPRTCALGSGGVTPPRVATASTVEPVATATEIAAGASSAKKPNRDTAAGLVRDDLAQKSQAKDRGDCESTTESDVREELVNMFNELA